MFRWISIGFILASLGLWIFFLLMDDPLVLELEEAPELKEESPMKIKNLELYEYQNDKEKYRIFSAEALIYEKREASFMDKVSAIVYDDQAQKPTLINSDRANMDGQSRLVTLKGSVELSYGENTSLNTEILYYDQAKELIFNRHPVLVKSKDDRIKAKKMTYDLKKGVLTLTRPTLLIHEN